MSWIQKLYETYNNCKSSIGYSTDAGVRPLLPICHITTQAHIEVVISADGNFRTARVITEKSDMTTIIPSTEGSASRAGMKPECHPLCDKLQYVAGDFSEYGGSVTSGFSKNPKEPYINYIDALSNWSNSEFSHPKARAVLKYVKKGTLIMDLSVSKVLYIEKSRFLGKDEVKREQNAKDIFSATNSNSQDGAFVRWVIEAPDILETKVWKDKSLWDSWTNYYLSSKEKDSVCYVTGHDAILTSNHPKYIRREGDGAKIISANDTTGFTFRGRFADDQQASSLSLEVSQKSHYALAWLISRQGYQKGDLVFVAWATSGAKVPNALETPLSVIDVEELSSDVPQTANTAQQVALKFKKKIAGYGKEIGETTDIVVMGLDSATTGRLAITYYRELKGSDFLRRIENWHESCAWMHQYGMIDVKSEKSDKTTTKHVSFVGAPSPNDIAEAAYGNRIDDKLRKATITRLVPCIIDGQPISRDLVESTTRRASNRVGIRDPKDKFEREWNKTLSIACSLYKKFKEKKEKFDMSLDETRNTRDYLYGRLLALADHIEESALRKAKEKRATNAARYMQQFAQHPFRTWNQIHSALTPYMVRLGGAGYYKSLISDVKDLFVNPEDFMNDKPLSGEYLLGYYCQRQKLWEKVIKDVPTQEVEGDIENSDK
jgi:CRISPR-associated protein Csd1